MTQKEKLLMLFRANNYQMTLGQLLQYGVGYKAVARFSEMRKKGINIELVSQDRQHPSNNLYVLKSMPNREGQQEMLV